MVRTRSGTVVRPFNSPARARRAVRRPPAAHQALVAADPDGFVSIDGTAFFTVVLACAVAIIVLTPTSALEMLRINKAPKDEWLEPPSLSGWDVVPWAVRKALARGMAME